MVPTSHSRKCCSFPSLRCDFLGLISSCGALPLLSTTLDALFHPNRLLLVCVTLFTSQAKGDESY